MSDGSCVSWTHILNVIAYMCYVIYQSYISHLLMFSTMCSRLMHIYYPSSRNRYPRSYGTFLLEGGIRKPGPLLLRCHSVRTSHLTKQESIEYFKPCIHTCLKLFVHVIICNYFKLPTYYVSNSCWSVNFQLDTWLPLSAFLCLPFIF